MLTPPTLSGWVLFAQGLTFVSAVIAAVGNVLNPLAQYSDHLAAAKGFTILKHDAGSLRETFSAAMTDDALSAPYGLCAIGMPILSLSAGDRRKVLRGGAQGGDGWLA